ncbi:hypothetical protein FACS1894152_5680 [Bacilli bacterium]|nr:hypothetical protein FACS1894152_5680 [Bacilli bacterium]
MAVPREPGKRTKHSKKKVESPFDSITATNYDKSQTEKILKATTGNKQEKEHRMGNDSTYVAMKKRANIAEKSNVTLSDAEKTQLWSEFSRQYGITGTMEEFCKTNKIDMKALMEFLKNKYLWEKFIGEHLLRTVRSKFNEKIVSDYMEYRGVGVSKNKYDLARISIDYANSKQKNEALDKLIKMTGEFNNKNADSHSKQFDANGAIKIDSVFEDDLHKDIAENIKHIEVGEVGKPVCQGSEKGSCFIFMVNKKELYSEVDETKKVKVANAVFSKLMNNKEQELLRDYSSRTRVVMYNQ